MGGFNGASCHLNSFSLKTHSYTTHAHTNTHTCTDIISPLRYVTTPLRGSRHHHLQSESLSSCLRRTHTKTPSPWERWTTYQGYGCPGQQWLSSQSSCEEAEVGLAVYCRLPCRQSDDVAGFPEREKTSGKSGWQRDSAVINTLKKNKKKQQLYSHASDCGASRYCLELTY